ncbi:MAG: integrase core domain-containing protein [Filomicrobium sp.]
MNERFNETLRCKLRSAERLATTRQIRVIINQWLGLYNHFRSHQARTGARGIIENRNLGRLRIGEIPAHAEGPKDTQSRPH